MSKQTIAIIITCIVTVVLLIGIFLFFMSDSNDFNLIDTFPTEESEAARIAENERLEQAMRERPVNVPAVQLQISEVNFENELLTIHASFLSVIPEGSDANMLILVISEHGIDVRKNIELEVHNDNDSYTYEFNREITIEMTNEEYQLFSNDDLIINITIETTNPNLQE